MAVYVFIYAFLAFFAQIPLNRRSSIPVLLFFLLFLFLFSGWRLAVGCDHFGYLARFLKTPSDLSWANVFATTEFGFEFVISSIKSSGLDYMWLNVVSAAFFIFAFARFSLRSPLPLYVLALAFPIFVVQLSMSGLRQSWAAGFLMLALVSFMDQKRWATALWILVGATFHTSLILLLPLCLLAGRDFSLRRVLVSLFVLAPVAVYFLADRIQVYDTRYLSEGGASASIGGLLRLGLLVISAAFFEVARNKVKDRFPNEYSMMRVFSLMTFALIPIAFISTVIVHRVGYYILPVQLFTLSVLVMIWRDNFNSRQLLKAVPLMVYGLYIVVWFSTSYHANACYTPYESYLLSAN